MSSLKCYFLQIYYPLNPEESHLVGDVAGYLSLPALAPDYRRWKYQQAISGRFEVRILESWEAGASTLSALRGVCEVLKRKEFLSNS